jgi:hypothetical protein
MKDVTSTSFGLLIAFFLPGLVGFYSLGFWFLSIRMTFNTFLTAESNVGLFLLVSAGCIVSGLQVSLIRWIIFEKLLCRSIRFDESDFEGLGKDEAKLSAFRACADEHYRYNQFWGGMFVVLPVLFIGWFQEGANTFGCLQEFLMIFAFVAMELLTGYGAKVGFEYYVKRGKQILKGG